MKTIEEMMLWCEMPRCGALHQRRSTTVSRMAGVVYRGLRLRDCSERMRTRLAGRRDALLRPPMLSDRITSLRTTLWLPIDI